MLNKRLLYVTGLPRSGSTLLYQMLAHHSDLYSIAHSSLLCQTLIGLRYHLSNSDFLLSQLDVDFDLTYKRLLNTFRGFMNGRCAETDNPWAIDKNCGWLHHIETVSHLDPTFRMLVCARELGQVYASIKSQHQKTLLDFPDHLASLSRFDRATNLFAKNGVVGAPLRSMAALQDLDSQLQQHLYYVVYEQLISEPLKVMEGIFDWLGLSSAAIDVQALTVKPHESDSYYLFKYRH